MPDFTFTPVDHDPYVDDQGRILERIPPKPMPQDVLPAYAAKAAESLAEPIRKTYYSATPMEAAQNATEAILGMAGPLPAKGAGVGLAAAAPFLGRLARAAEPELAPAAKGIRAFHGSPYDFEKFDLSKIGTGEGSQSHGPGVYLAENPEVAQHYKTLTQTVGKTYEVNVSADLDHFLHWDKPLNEQNDYVTNALRKLPGGEQIATSKQTPQSIVADMPEQSQQLRSVGIPGIKYPDRGSSGWQDVKTPEGRAVALISEAGGDRSKAIDLAEDRFANGRIIDKWMTGKALELLKGDWKYPVTHNYVVFDDKLIDILKKYGLAGLIAGGAGHFATTPVEGDPFREPPKRQHGGRVNAANIDRAPTEAQKKAGNYAKDHVHIHGMDFTIENAKGHFRRGVDKGGQPWSVRMSAHYGYIKGTVGKDKDHVDIYLGPHPKSPRVFVVDQLNAETGKFDEHKALIGFPSKLAAITCYHKGFSDGRSGERLGAITEMDIEHFKRWLEQGDTGKPVHQQVERAA